ncbi:hypothetical protein [Sorangium sp. So ce388]|uniref:hypothetical protein n=1 Tax=Sorangium sp. So ce388 TaxID=3133309 RepID=UPI003F5CB2DE
MPNDRFDRTSWTFVVKAGRVPLELLDGREVAAAEGRYLAEPADRLTLIASMVGCWAEMDEPDDEKSGSDDQRTITRTGEPGIPCSPTRTGFFDMSSKL